uniref:Uncharacterized protein n=1 Tax=Saccharum spontaneum TaxID=62335 RepID=A0A678TQ01_SACSP|nr:hypothetical protein SS48H02_000002 [Saccharum spontaneum]
MDDQFGNFFSAAVKACSNNSAKKWSFGQEFGPLDSVEKRRKQLPQVDDQVDQGSINRPGRRVIAINRPVDLRATRFDQPT